ncbi:uncharacterized protein LOC129777235 [Toxorhynchites rutilus septentrionalis]|uniref:uncharacterized protein LOC129777235 n=1 Tax=Toxorhynchites rutilus septentrionalis TaxID=329112 RepID=UPI00247A8936|nr:uncharacterized protein LOC129777235 [Toxorhynchites rutilus septentrionalis]
MDGDRRETYLKQQLLTEILSRNPDLRGAKVLQCTLRMPQSMDGFMATIYNLEVTFRETGCSESKDLNILIKVMKGDEDFRRQSLGLILFPNEINVYRNILPAFKQLITDSKSSIEAGTWCPRIYYSEQGSFPGYSDQFETILAMQNVQCLGFVSGPRLDLDEDHLTLMTRKIAQFHACSYALRILNNQKLNQLVEAIIPLNFIQDGKIFFESCDLVFRYTQERMYKYFDANTELVADTNVRADIEMLRKIYGSEPSRLMQRCLEQDDVYSVILHGDYNRNNVLFKYQNETPVDMIMIDFQENRFGSPALDLSFFMYMNMTEDVRERSWDRILRCYHQELFECICKITDLPADDVRLEPYSFESIMLHLNDYLAYGAMIAVKFLPVMMGLPEEVELIVHYFHNDIHADGFKEIIQKSGGDVANRRIMSVVSHCSRMGYLKFLWK